MGLWGYLRDGPQGSDERDSTCLPLSPYRDTVVRWHLWRIGLHQTLNLSLPCSWTSQPLELWTIRLTAYKLPCPRQTFLLQQPRALKLTFRSRGPCSLCSPRLIAHSLNSCAGSGCFVLCVQLLGWWGSTFWEKEKEHIVTETPMKASSTLGSPFQEGPHVFGTTSNIVLLWGPLLCFVTKFFFLFFCLAILVFLLKPR